MLDCYFQHPENRNRIYDYSKNKNECSLERKLRVDHAFLSQEGNQ